MSARPDKPMVSVAVPMLNEQGYIECCLEAFAMQTYGVDALDVIVIDGGSTDGSREWVARYAERHAWVRLVDNEKRSAASAFNLGVENAKGDVVCLFSAHGVPAPDYVEHSVGALHRSGAAGVGGRYLHEGLDRASRAIGLAMVSPFGMASTHRFATHERDVDTISHPAYWKDAMVETERFDERLARNSDYEFNVRMRALGHRLVFDPSISSVYRPRPSLRALARQFWWYGRWKARVARQHPGSIRPRHLVAPVAAAAAITTPIWLNIRAIRPIVFAGWSAYALGVGVATAAPHPKDKGAAPTVLGASFPIMHGAWGAGFLLSTIEDLLRRKR
ncbi:MAG: glycosyltransferase family 2 protein [Acidimicrobiales bacterium]